jgi:hypothetical protein
MATVETAALHQNITYNLLKIFKDPNPKLP